MWNVWTELDRAISDLNALRTWMDEATDDGPARLPFWGVSNRGPSFDFHDLGNEFVVTGEVPGMTEADFEISLTADLLTLRGERKISVPEGFKVHRRERVPYSFSRSFALPAPIDPERTAATLKNGLLTVTLAKSEAAKPRRIEVKG